MGILTAVWLAVLTAAPPDRDDTFFESRVRPVLADRCVKCHGPEKASGGLRLDSRAGLLTGGDSGPAVVARNPADSLLVKAVKRLDGVSAMPRDKPLDPRAVADLERWVREGAVWP